MKPYNMLVLIASAFFAVQVFAAVTDLYTYNDNILPLFQEYGCTDCHSWADTYDELMAKVSDSTSTSGTPMVKPNDSAGSVLTWRLKGVTSAGTNVTRMPRGQDPLSVGTITKIEEWINSGAPEAAVTVSITTWGKLKSLFK